jgi:hypothetical protein
LDLAAGSSSSSNSNSCSVAAARAWHTCVEGLDLCSTINKKAASSRGTHCWILMAAAAAEWSTRWPDLYAASPAPAAAALSRRLSLQTALNVWHAASIVTCKALGAAGQQYLGEVRAQYPHHTSSSTGLNCCAIMLLCHHALRVMTSPLLREAPMLLGRMCKYTCLRQRI